MERLDTEPDVWSVKALHQKVRIAHPQPVVIWPEVVAPLADAMRLVDHEERRPRSSQLLQGFLLRSANRWKASRRPTNSIFELIGEEGRSSSSSFSTWSCCSAINGETTTDGPGSITPAI